VIFASRWSIGSSYQDPAVMTMVVAGYSGVVLDLMKPTSKSGRSAAGGA
jgi:hypothetical protein